jgi:hypothetical protein
MSDEIPLESVLPEEAITEIRKVVAEVLSQQPRKGILEGNVYRPFPTAFSQSSASVTPKYIATAASKQLWDALSGSTVIAIMLPIILFFCQKYLDDRRGQQSEVFLKNLVREVEEAVLAHKERPQPTSEISVNPRGD